LLQVNLEAEMSDAMLWTEIGNIYLKLGASQDAITAFTKAVELNPSSGWAYSSLGQAYLLTGEYGHALFLFRKSIQLLDTAENQAIVWNKIGDAYRALKDIDNAIQAYRKADALDMGVAQAYKKNDPQPIEIAEFEEIKKTDCSEDIENLDRAQNSAIAVPINTVASREDPNNNLVCKDGFKFVNEEKEQNYLDAIPNPTDTKPVNLEKLVRNGNPDFSPPGLGNLRNSVDSVGEIENPTLNKDRPLIIIPEPARTAPSFPDNGRSSNSDPQYNKKPASVEMGEQNKEGKQKGQSSIGYRNDDLEELLAKVNIYENITRVNPTSDRGWDTLGKLYKALGRYKDAIGAYQKAIEVAPDKEVYYYYLGLLFSVEQQHDDAIQAFQFVLRKNPDYVLAHSALAGVYHRMGQENKANHHISIALPKMNNESTYNRACFYVICGDQELAFEFLRLALKNKETTIDWIKSDPDLDPIRADQRYQELISEDDQPALDRNNENYFSSELEGKRNKLLPILNHSLTR
jgi:tetratricopeptide (TPR) repeat protein